MCAGDPACLRHRFLYSVPSPVELRATGDRGVEIVGCSSLPIISEITRFLLPDLITLTLQLIGQVPAKPGTERLRGAHLRHLLAKEMAPSLFAAFTAEKGLNGVIDIDRLLTVDSSSHQLEAIY